MSAVAPAPDGAGPTDQGFHLRLDTEPTGHDAPTSCSDHEETAVLHPDDIRDHRFSVVLRGYDQTEVQEFLLDIAEGVARLQADAADVTDGPTGDVAEDLVAASTDDLADDAAADEARLRDPRNRRWHSAELGRATAAILETAEKAAEEMIVAAEAQVEDLVAQARHDRESAADDRAAADEARRSSDSLLERARAEVDGLLAAARAEHDELTAQSETMRAHRSLVLAQLHELQVAVETALHDDLGWRDDAGSPADAEPGDDARLADVPLADAGPDDDAPVTGADLGARFGSELDAGLDAAIAAAEEADRDAAEGSTSPASAYETGVEVDDLHVDDPRADDLAGPDAVEHHHTANSFSRSGWPTGG